MEIYAKCVDFTRIAELSNIASDDVTN